MSGQAERTITHDKEKCENTECTNTATKLVFSRTKEKILKLCDKCCKDEEYYNQAEYSVRCPNCSCKVPVN